VDAGGIARRALDRAPRWSRYDAVLRVEHGTGEVVLEADDASAADRMLARLATRARAPCP